MNPEVVEAGGHTWAIVNERICVLVSGAWVEWGHFDPHTGEPVRETTEPAANILRLDPDVAEALTMARRRFLFRSR